MDELFVSDIIVLTYVLFHNYPIDIQSKRKLFWLIRKKKFFNDNGKYNIRY